MVRYALELRANVWTSRDLALAMSDSDRLLLPGLLLLKRLGLLVLLLAVGDVVTLVPLLALIEFIFVLVVIWTRFSDIATNMIYI